VSDLSRVPSTWPWSVLKHRRSQVKYLTLCLKTRQSCVWPQLAIALWLCYLLKQPRQMLKAWSMHG